MNAPAPMSARERLFAVLEGRPTDRLPIWLLFPYHEIGCYVDVRNHPDYQEIFEYSKNKVIMLNWLYSHSDLQEFSVWSLTKADEIKGFLDRIQKHKLIVYRYFLERDAADIYFMVGSELAAPPIGNCTFTQAFGAVGDSMALIGNIQYGIYQNSLGKRRLAIVQDIPAGEEELL